MSRKALQRAGVALERNSERALAATMSAEEGRLAVRLPAEKGSGQGGGVLVESDARR